MEKQYLDNKARLLGVGVVTRIGAISPESENVKINLGFYAAVFSISIPRQFVFNQQGARVINVGERLWIDATLTYESNTKTYNERTYTSESIKILEVNEVRQLTPEEKKAL